VRIKAINHDEGRQMTNNVIRLADHRKPRPAAISPAFNPNWFAAEYAAAYARLFAGMANAWDNCAKSLRAADVFDDLRPCDSGEPPDGDAA